jgi:hypothetical protein
MFGRLRWLGYVASLLHNDVPFFPTPCPIHQTLGPFMASRYRSTSAIHEGNARTVLSAFISAALRRGEKQLEAFVAVGDDADPVHVSQARWHV